MSKHILAYATWAGSTTGVAETIGQTLREAGADVDVCPVVNVDDLDEYDAVILGAAVHPASHTANFCTSPSDTIWG